MSQNDFNKSKQLLMFHRKKQRKVQRRRPSRKIREPILNENFDREALKAFYRNAPCLHLAL